MSMRLLVGIDDRDGGADALELARVLGSGGSATVVSVLFGGPMPLEYALLPDDDAEDAAPLFAQARERLQGISVETRAYGGGSPAGILTSLAERDEFDLIVVGSPHRGTIGRVMMGSVALSLLNGASTDVVVAPKGYASGDHGEPRTIAVGYDGSAESKLALRRAEAIAARSNSVVRLITVVQPAKALPVLTPGVYAPQLPLEPDKVINEGVHSVDDALAAESRRLEGEPAAALVRECEEGVDLLVLGSRGYGPIARVLLGSTSRHVVQNAPCPVLVVPRP